jgi:hypothetical protein
MIIDARGVFDSFIKIEYYTQISTMSGYNNVTDRIVMMILRWLLVFILCVFIVLFSVDYLLLHGDMILNKAGGAPVVNFLDNTVGRMFMGQGTDINRLFLAAISIGFFVGLIGIVYKFIRKD